MADPTGGTAKRASKATAKQATSRASRATAATASTKATAATKATTTPATRSAPLQAASPPAAAPAPVSATPGDTTGGRSISLLAITVVLVLAAAVLLLRLGAQERGGPAHGEVSIGDGLPATLYLPVDADDDGALPDPLPQGQRPPVIVVGHGYSADRASMSGLARSFARAGYAVLSFDFRGHGTNDHAFEGDLRDDFATAVSWVETSPHVDGERVAVLGHSMGAGAALDFASVDSRPRAVIPLSGGWIANDAVVPSHALLIAASGDPDRILERQATLAAQLEAAGSNVTLVKVGGTDHLTILRSSEAVQEIVSFLDGPMEVARAGEVPGIDDPRYKTAAMYLLVLLGLLALVGLLTSRLAPAGPDDSQGPPIYSGFVLVAAALLLTLPVMAVAPISPFPLGAGQPIVIHLALASGLLWGLRALAQRGELSDGLTCWVGARDWLPTWGALRVGLAAGGAIFALLVPLSGVFHTLVPNPERLGYWVGLSVLVLPFFAAFEALLRRDGARRSVLWAALGRVLLLLVLVVGLGLGTVPTVVSLVLPLLVVQYAMLEVFAAAAYARARNAAVVAVVDAFVVGWLAVMLSPVG